MFPTVTCPAGRFLMGSPDDETGRYNDEGPQREVTLTQPFAMGITPVSQAQWKAVVEAAGLHREPNPAHFNGDPALPVEQVSWFDAVAFCTALSKLEGLRPAYRIDGGSVEWDREADGYRLPTEAEWEYAARAGEGWLFAGGDELDAVAWHRGNSGDKTRPVGQKKSNAWGLHDMSGNVWEWVWDWYRGYEANPVGPRGGSYRVYRGGSWFNSARVARVAYRNGTTPDDRGHNLGLRLARTIS